jgi:hypothetical protein
MWRHVEAYMSFLFHEFSLFLERPPSIPRWLHVEASKGIFIESYF